MPDQQKPPSKQAQLREVLHQHHGNELQAPNKKQLANYAAHLATNDSEYSDFTGLLGMYAGYYVIQTSHDEGKTIVATRLRLNFAVIERWKSVEGSFGEYEKTGETFLKGNHTRWIYSHSIEGTISGIIAQIAYNAGYRNQNKGRWQRQLPSHLQRYPHARSSGW